MPRGQSMSTVFSGLAQQASKSFTDWALERRNIARRLQRTELATILNAEGSKEESPGLWKPFLNGGDFHVVDRQKRDHQLPGAACGLANLLLAVVVVPFPAVVGTLTRHFTEAWGHCIKAPDRLCIRIRGGAFHFYKDDVFHNGWLPLITQSDANLDFVQGQLAQIALPQLGTEVFRHLEKARRDLFKRPHEDDETNAARRFAGAYRYAAVSATEETYRMSIDADQVFFDSGITTEEMTKDAWLITHELATS